MAYIDGKFIRGTAGAVIFKKVGKKQVVVGKSKKEFIDMTPATYNAAYVFGRASTLASYIRGSAEPIIGFHDGGMISRFTGECNQIVQKASTDKEGVFDFRQDYFNRLNGFEFNNMSPVKNYLFAQPIVSLTEQNVTIDFPEIKVPKDLKFPPNARYCTVAFSVTLFDLENDQFQLQDIQSFEIEITAKSFIHPAQQLIFESSTGSLCVVTLALYYSEKTFAGNAVINNKDFCPSAVLKAEFCPGEQTKQEGWMEMVFNEKKKHKKASKPKKKRDDQSS
ncbi:hypothetical protein ABDJ41_04480 [Pedobacter sp. ASV1-7]|uniref:hypothetical protein n=1 Tax=Pedobacter sp. ASV1-7 TaxID=3145237 RepID=UPI0032E915F3